MLRRSIEPYLGRLAQLHRRLCPKQVLGLRIGQWAGELLGLELPRADKRLFAFVEIDGCFADGVSVATGCWLGGRTLRLVDTARVAATCVDLESGRAIRMWPNPRARMLAMRFAPDAPSHWHAQLVGYQIMPATELLRSTPVVITASSLAVLPGNQHPRAECVDCGEEFFSTPEADRAGRVLCAGCTGLPYYGLTAVKRYLARPQAQDGFDRMMELNMIDLRIEAVILQRSWSSLFTPRELASARTRLASVSYESVPREPK